MGWNKDEGEAGAAQFNCTLVKNNKGQRAKHEDECDYCAQWNEGEELCTCPGGLAIAAAKPAAKHELCSRPRLQVPLHEIDLTQFSHLEPHLVHTGDSGKQEVHVNDVKALFSKKRSECNAS